MLPPDGTRAWSVETRTSLEMRAETRTTHEMMRVTWSACVREVATSRAAGENARARAFPGSSPLGCRSLFSLRLADGLDGDKLDRIPISPFQTDAPYGRIQKADITGIETQIFANGKASTTFCPRGTLECPFGAHAGRFHDGRVLP